MIIRVASLFCFLGASLFMTAQSWNVVPSSTACSCNGSASFNAATSAQYTVTDSEGVITAAGASASGVITLNNLCSQVYSILVTTNNGNATTYHINVPTATFNPGSAQQISVCSTDGSVNLNNQIPNLTNGGAWYSPTGSLITTQPLAASAMTEGWYTYVFNSGGCEIITGVYVDYIQNANAGLTTTYEICESYLPFVMLDFMQGNPDSGGQWYNPAGNTFDGVYDPATMNSGLYTYLIDTVPGCGPIFRTMNIDENVQPNAGEDNFIWVCADAASFSMLGQLGGNPDAGGQWLGPGNVPVGNSFNPSTMPAGNYRYVLQAEAPCLTDIAILTIQYYNQPAAGEDVTLSMCQTANPVNLFNALGGNPQTGGLWMAPDGSITDASFDPEFESSGTYTYFFNQVGCIGESSIVSITVEQTHEAGPDGNVSVCYNSGNIDLTSLLGANADQDGIWTNLNGNPVPTSYTLPTGTSSLGFIYETAGQLCPTDQAVITINIDSLSTDPANQSISLCSLDPPFNLSALYPGCPNVQFYSPSGALLSPVLNPNTFSGNLIIVEMPSNNSCPDGIGQISVSIDTPFWTTDTVSISVCQDDGTFDLNSALPATLQGGGSWYTMGNVLTGNIVNLTAPSTVWFRYALTNPPSCGDSDFYLELNVDSPVHAGPDGNHSFCYNDAPAALANLLPTTAGIAGNWTYQGAPYTAGIINPGIQPAGIYVFQLPANGACPADQAELNIFIEYGINYTAGQDIGACAGSPNVQIGLSNSPNLTYSWNPSTNLSSTSIAQPNVSFFTGISQDESIDYVVTVSDGICTITDTVEVITYALPLVDLGSDREICAGQTVSFAASEPGNNVWSPSNVFNGNAQTQTLTPTSNFTAVLTFTNADGCSATDSANVIVHPSPIIDFIPSFVSSCSPYAWHGELGSLSEHTDQVVWFIPGVGGFNGQEVDVIIEEPGLYDVQVTATSSFGCMTQQYVSDVIQVLSNPIAAFRYQPAELTTLEYVAQFTDLSNGALNYLWTFDEFGTSTDPEPSFAFPHEDPATFQVCLRVENEYGCADSTCRSISLDNEYILFAPNAFTPDDDGINDTFLPVLRGFDNDTYHLQIYDRWGEMVFETRDVSEPWTGNVRGGEYYGEDNVYNWIIRIKDREISDFQLFRGSVILLR